MGKKKVIVDLFYHLDATNKLPLDYSKPYWGLEESQKPIIEVNYNE